MVESRPDEQGRTAQTLDGTGRFPLPLVHTAATLYYLQDATQAEIAQRLGTSRATVSRLLRDARERGLVRIEVPPLPEHEPAELAGRLAQALRLEQVRLSAEAAPAHVAEAVSPVVGRALSEAGLRAGDVLLVSSGRTVYEIARRSLPELPGVLVAPVVGGQDEPEPWYQTNEITRRVAAAVGGVPRFLYAPAFPGRELRASLDADPVFQRFVELWRTARCVVTGIGAPPLQRDSIPSFVPTVETALRDSVGDIATRFYDASGREIPYDGSDRVVAVPFEALHRVPTRIAVAHGAEKVPGIVAGARGGHFNQLITDPGTATRVLAALQEES
ncbi:sugar-binding transcriptional regulator [Kineococcus arenarius]|uniref:sugar-binding transcriptional regulator n=1 Tax=Kineococcus sp. SYSU DK007 TaxID=3383128 RepID=UPI003D7E6D4E